MNKQLLYLSIKHYTVLHLKCILSTLTLFLLVLAFHLHIGYFHFRTLEDDFEQEAQMRRLFWKARTKAKAELKNQLETYNDTLARGMSRIYYGSASDADLRQCIDNRHKELQVIEQVLQPLIESLS